MTGPVLVANRGEIAVRLIRAYRDLGVRAIAVYSDADAGAPHVRLADEAIRLGPAPVAASYLNQDAVIDAARAAGAAAVDPGYGLLSENAEFAAAVAAAGLVFIGPPAGVIATMGDKLAARALASRAKVPVVPGSAALAAPGDALAAAARLGYPVLVKASAGGGGRGLRIARDAAALPGALAAAAAEAQAAFGQPGVYLERPVPDARHVEVQVLADEHGTVLCLGDRDCSVQRRHQKLIEEAPAPFLPDGVRAAMHEAAARLAAEAGYRSTGTVEFLYSPASGGFWFLEMNTRLQVEHGVTELVTGLDLVELRLAVAAGAPLRLTQDDVRIRGHAIEARLAAEDPWREFLPVSGTVTGLHVPADPWLRADLGVTAGDRVPAEYDSLFGKLMAWGPDRETARRRLAAALGELRVSGLPSTAPYLRDVLLRPEFIDGSYSTTTLEERWPPRPDERPPADKDQDHGTPGSGRPAAAGATARRVRIRTNAGPFVVKIHGRPGPGAAPVRAGRGGAGPRPGPRAQAPAGQPAAPMDGVVVKVGVARGDQVERHAVLVVLEAMKMQIPVTAPWPGRVTALLVAEGDSVTAGQPLAEVTDAAGE
ncbi:MAG TPA: biotin carboxylase N-terminal domain-containing protein [Streptosporangiaceae bacterium]|nr:biotin carboxylase N-terminal domain-containing protein [Streptosporangiaceae bacterium]